LCFTPKGPDGSAAPSTPPDKVSIVLVCSSNKKGSAAVAVRGYDEHFDDGRWHKIAIPLADFMSGPQGAEFDPTTAWEFQVSTWNDSPHEFNVYVDQIGAQK
jgi:hypothetical protein